jgi:prepilin-type N-terminal cleavage/methylation domain-containing protein
MFAMVSREGRTGRRAGFSLLEVMVGVAILATLTLSSMLVFVPVSRQARINREVAMANSEARRILEKVHAVPFTKVQDLFPDGIEIPIAALPDGKIVTSYVDPATDPLVMRAVLTWDSPNVGPMMRTFFTVMTR